jgi:hypothetical protein
MPKVPSDAEFMRRVRARRQAHLRSTGELGEREAWPDAYFVSLSAIAGAQEAAEREARKRERLQRNAAASTLCLILRLQQNTTSAKLPRRGGQASVGNESGDAGSHG